MFQAYLHKSGNNLKYQEVGKMVDIGKVTETQHSRSQATPYNHIYKYLHMSILTPNKIRA